MNIQPNVPRPIIQQQTQAQKPKTISDIITQVQEKLRVCLINFFLDLNYLIETRIIIIYFLFIIIKIKGLECKFKFEIEFIFFVFIRN